jgi:methionine-rich copper-binding protein CopC
VALAVVIAGVALTATRAGAHARLDESTPGVGAVLEAAPTEVSITFTQDVQKISGTYGIDVFNESNAEVTTEDATLSDADRRMMRVPLPAGLPEGRYVVRYKNVSDEDGDPFEGAFPFYIGRAPTAEERAADELLLGEEDETPTASAASPTVAASPSAAARTPVATATSTATDDDDSGGNITLFLVLGAIALVAIAVAGGFFAYSRRGG